MSREQDQRLVEAYERIVEKVDWEKDFEKKRKEGVRSAVWAKDFPISLQIRKDGSVHGVSKKTGKDIRISNNTNVFHILGYSYSKSDLKKAFSDADIKDAEKAKKIIKKQLLESIDEGAMKNLAFDLFDEIEKYEKSIAEMAKKTRKVAPQVFKHLNNALKELTQAKTSLPVTEEKEPLNEFVVNLRGGKVPIGLWSFEYIPAKGKKDIQFLINSMKHRDPEAIIKLKNSVVMTAFAGPQHSLINSLVRLQFDGEVKDWDRKEKGTVVYQKEGK